MRVNNLNKAYESVKRNGGSAGVDGMKITELRAWLKHHGKDLINRVMAKSYQPAPIRSVSIPKPNGGTRLLGIPTVIDRLLQQAIHQQLTPLYEPLFSTYSYGFRPGRSAHQAIEQASEYVKAGYEWVVDIDLANFFDRINHDRLMQRLSKGIADKRILRLIRQYLVSGIMQEGISQQRTSGTPQGSPLSPLLSNIVLDELDKELEKRGHKFVRYADDCNIYVRSQVSGQRVLQSIRSFIEGKLKLNVNEQKSGVHRCEQVRFLGYTLMPGGKIRISDKNMDRFKSKVVAITKRNRALSFQQVIKELNGMMRGWVNYFYRANCWLHWRQVLDKWIRRRLRCYRLKQCKRRYTLFKFLRGLGVSTRKAWNVVMYSGGWWRMSNKPVCMQAMGIHWFSENGLYKLEDLFNQRVKH
ncbi:MAG: group II intron reverse transcriptase/maturase [Saprospiraceae bacterium]